MLQVKGIRVDAKPFRVLSQRRLRRSLERKLAEANTSYEYSAFPTRIPLELIEMRDDQAADDEEKKQPCITLAINYSEPVTPEEAYGHVAPMRDVLRSHKRFRGFAREPSMSLSDAFFSSGTVRPGNIMNFYDEPSSKTMYVEVLGTGVPKDDALDAFEMSGDNFHTCELKDVAVQGLRTFTHQPKWAVAVERDIPDEALIKDLIQQARDIPFASYGMKKEGNAPYKTEGSQGMFDILSPVYSAELTVRYRLSQDAHLCTEPYTFDLKAAADRQESYSEANSS